MENKLAKWICRRLRAKQVVDEEYEEVYVYGLELILSFMISTSIVLVIGILFEQIISTLTFLATFILIRQYTGGYHANSYIMCKFCTVLSYSVSILLANIFPVSRLMFLVLLTIGCLIIWLFGPIENKHKPLTDQEKRKHKITALTLFVIWSVTGFAISFSMPLVSNTVFYTLCAIIILMIIPLLERRTHHEKAR